MAYNQFSKNTNFSSCIIVHLHNTGSQHWKKKPALKKNKDKQAAEKRKVMFDEGTGEKKERKKAAKKDRVFIDFTKAPE